MAEQYLTVEQAASRLHIHPMTVRRHLRSGALRGIKRGSLWRVPESALGESAVAVKREIKTESAFEQALVLVAQLEAEMQDLPRRVAGINDAAAEIRQMRDAETP